MKKKLEDLREINFYETEKRLKEKIKSSDWKENIKPLVPLLVILLIIVPLLALLVSTLLPSEKSEQQKIDEAVFAEADDYSEKYPIVSLLPYAGEGFRIDYGLCEKEDAEFCLHVSAFSNYLKNARTFLLSLEEYDALEYKIEFPDFLCPFKSSDLNPSELKIKPLEGNYYGAVLDFSYRVLLEKSGSSYRVLTEPKLLFSYSDYEKAEKSIIRKLNML